MAADSAVVHRDKHSPDGDKWQDPPLPKSEWRGTRVVPQQHPWQQELLGRQAALLERVTLMWDGAREPIHPTEDQRCLPGLVAAVCRWGNIKSKALTMTQG